MHGDHHVAPVSPGNTGTNHVHEAVSSSSVHEKHAAVSDMEGEDHTSGQCCGDACLSAVLIDSRRDFEGQVTRGKYLLPYSQPASAKTLGLLRPPRILT